MCMLPANVMYMVFDTWSLFLICREVAHPCCLPLGRHGVLTRTSSQRSRKLISPLARPLRLCPDPAIHVLFPTSHGQWLGYRYAVQDSL